MSKTIKIIDLLNKIANGEDVPTEIKYKNSFYKWEQYHEKYWYYETALAFFRALYLSDNILNDTVEIIEEQEEIDIQSIEKIEDIFIEISSCGEDVKYLARKYNEILKWAKQLDKKTKEKK